MLSVNEPVYEPGWESTRLSTIFTVTLAICIVSEIVAQTSKTCDPGAVAQEVLITSVDLAGTASGKNSKSTPGGKPATDQLVGGQDDSQSGTLAEKLAEAPAGIV